MTYRAVTTTNTPNETSTSLTWTSPAVTVGNLLIAFAQSRGNTTAIGAPAGWTNIGSVSNATTPGGVLEAWYRFATLTDEQTQRTSTLTFSATWTGNKGVTLACLSFQDVDSLDAEFSTVQSTSSVSSLTIPAITLDRAGDLLGAMGRTNNNNTYTPPSGMTERSDTNGDAANTTLSTFTEARASGATGTKTPTGSTASTRYAAFMTAALNAIRPIHRLNPRSTTQQTINNTSTLTLSTTAKPLSNHSVQNPKNPRPTTTPKPLITHSVQNPKHPRHSHTARSLVDQSTQSPQSLALQLVQKYLISQFIEQETLKIVSTPVNAGNTTGGTTHTFSRPTNPLQNGDYVVAIYSQRGQADEPSPPTGWFSGGFITNSTSPGGGSGIWYKKFNQSDIDSDTGTYTASFTTRQIVTSTQIIRGSESISAPSLANTGGASTATLTYTSITATKRAIALAFLGRNFVNTDPTQDFIAPTGFIDLTKYIDSNQGAALGTSYKYFDSGSTGDITYTFGFATSRLSGGFLLFYKTTGITLSFSTTAKPTATQSAQNPKTPRIQTRSTPLVDQNIQLEHSTDLHTILKPTLTQTANNPSTLQFSPLNKAQIVQNILTPSILNQQLKTQIISQQSVTIIQDAILITFQARQKTQISQNIIVQNDLIQQITVQNTVNQSAQNTSRVQHSAQINQNVLVSVQNQSRLFQTVQNKPQVNLTAQNASTLQSTTQLSPLLDQNIITQIFDPAVITDSLAIAHIHQTILNPNHLQLSTNLKTHAQIICQGTLIRPKFSVGMSREFFVTRFNVNFTLQDL